PRNELYLYEIGPRSGRRLDSAVSHFAALWLSEEILAYDSGLGKSGTVQLFDLRGDRRTVLRCPYGAGLFGLPIVLCREPIEETLLNRAVRLHPDKEFPALSDLPDNMSLFRNPNRKTK